MPCATVYGTLEMNPLRNHYTSEARSVVSAAVTVKLEPEYAAGADPGQSL